MGCLNSRIGSLNLGSWTVDTLSSRRAAVCSSTVTRCLCAHIPDMYQRIMASAVFVCVVCGGNCKIRKKKQKKTVTVKVSIHQVKIEESRVKTQDSRVKTQDSIKTAGLSDWWETRSFLLVVVTRCDASSKSVTFLINSVSRSKCRYDPLMPIFHFSK